MRLLIDTHVLIWAVDEPRRLPPDARTAVEDSSNTVFVSLATVWEISIKAANGRLDFPLDDLRGVLEELDMQVLDITVEDAILAGRLPNHHRDPFDRMLVAQALNHGLTLVTLDGKIPAYDVPLLPL